MRTLLEIGLGNAVGATLLAALACAGARLCRHPAMTHGLWLLVFVKLLTPPLFRLPIDLDTPAPRPTPESVSIVHESAEPMILDRDALAATLSILEQSPAEPGNAVPAFGLVEGITVLWLAGSAVWFCWTALSLLTFRRLLACAGTPSAALQLRVDELSRQLGLRTAPRVALVPGRLSPMVWSFLGRPRLLFPARLFDSLSPDQTDTLILHELAHLARRDHWVRWLELLASGLYWWLPVVWLARRALHAAEEECCDRAVTRALPGSGCDYALALVQTLAFLAPARTTLPPAASAAAAVSQIKRRLAMILRKQSISLVARLGGAVLLGLALVALPWAPTIAQQPKEQQPSPQQLRRQQIEVLRQLLKSLEQEQQAEEQALRAKNTFVVETLNQPAQPKKTAEGTQFLIEAIVDAQKTAADQQKKLAEDHAKRAKEAEMRLRIKAAQPKAGDVVQAKDEIDQLRAKIAQAESDLGAAQANLVQLQAALDKLALHKSKAQPATGEFFAISLRSAQASDMAKILNDLFSAHPSDKSRITIVPDPRTNTLLIQAAADDLITVRTLIERLDIGTEKKTRN